MQSVSIKTRKPLDPDKFFPWVQALVAQEGPNILRTKGILTVAAGDNVVRVLPPLTIDESHIAEFVEGLSAAAAAYDVPEAA